MHCIGRNLNLDLQFARESSMKPKAWNDVGIDTFVVDLCLPKNLVFQCFTYALFALTKTGYSDSESAPYLLRDAGSSLLLRVNASANLRRRLSSIAPNSLLQRSQLGTVHRCTFGGVESGYQEEGKAWSFVGSVIRVRQ
jgi:hypothetical protein